MSKPDKIISTLRNTLLLSLLLGLTWITAAVPTSAAQQWASVLLNGLTGVYILVYSVLANKSVRGGVRMQMSTYYSSVMSSEKVTHMDKISSRLDNRKYLHRSPRRGGGGWRG